MEPVLTAAPTALGTGESGLDNLVGRAQGGDPEAFGDLVEAAWRDLVALARATLASSNDAEDVVQEACVHAWNHLPALRDPAGFHAWLRRSVVRRCWRLARQRRREAELEAGMDPAIPPRESGIDAPRLMRHLSPRQRAVTYLTVVEGCTDSEIARQLGLLPATVRVHRHLAMRKLRRLLRGDRDEP